MTPFERAARAHAASRGSPGTASGYVRDLERWLAWCAERRKKPEKPTLQMATDYRAELERSYEPQTVRRALAALSSMYEAALGFEKTLVSWNPWKRLPRPPADAYLKTEAVPDRVVRRMFALIEASVAGVRDLAILRLLYDTGLRCSEVAKLRRKDLVYRESGMVARVIVKGRRRVDVEIPTPTRAAVEAWLEKAPASDYVFPATPPRIPVARSTINDILERRGLAAGYKGLHPHQLRAAYITTALDIASLRDVQASVHHADPRTTLRYDRRRRGRGLAEAVAKHRQPP